MRSRSIKQIYNEIGFRAEMAICLKLSMNVVQGVVDLISRPFTITRFKGFRIGFPHLIFLSILDNINKIQRSTLFAQVS